MTFDVTFTTFRILILIRRGSKKNCPENLPTTANGKGLPSDEDLITVGTAIRITRQRCLEIIKQVKPIAQDLLHQI